MNGTAARGLGLLWRNRGGRFSSLKATVLVLAFLPGLWFAFALATDRLGARPLNAAIHGIGLWTLRFVLATLAVSPARSVFGWARIGLIRRMLGLAAAAYAVAHVSLFAIDQNLHLLHVAAEIVHRIYLAIGFTAWLGLAALAVTSTDAAMRRMGRDWKRLHRLMFGFAVLMLLHAFMQAKSNVSPTAMMAGFFAWLMLWRALPRRLQARPLALYGLAVLAALATAGIEASWYGLATRLDWHRVLAANLTFNLRFGLRPSAWVGLAGLAVALAATLRTLWPSRPGRPAGRGPVEAAAMRRILFPATLIVALLVPPAARAEPVLLELFTSQSCSSCPPAEALLSEMAAERDDVLPLALHVDYWNHLGWRDPYAEAAFTERQRRYAVLLHLDTVYTPQLVINGRREAIGSDRRAVLAAIEAARSDKLVTLRLTGDAQSLAVESGGGSGRATLYLVGFDTARTTRVSGGENGGRTLTEANIVRSLAPVGMWSGAPLRVTLKRPEGERAAAFLQAEDGSVLGVALLR